MTQPIAIPDDDTPPLDGEVADRLADLIHARHGLDFRRYARNSRNRRLAAFMRHEGIACVDDLVRRLEMEPASVNRLLTSMPIHVTEMFRNPLVFRVLRERILPHLATFPVIRVWLAGCATGEEAWSLAILLREAGLYERSRIYATDLSPELIARARGGHLPADVLPSYRDAYLASGGAATLDRHLYENSDGTHFDPDLGRNLMFAVHNLAIDHSFNEFQLILCRNVLIYFDHELQTQVHRLLFSSLARLGILCLGDAEHLAMSACAASYETVDDACRLYRKISTHCPGLESSHAY